MNKRIANFIADSAALIKKAQAARDGARTQEEHAKYSELVIERQAELRRFKTTFDVPLSADDLYDIAFLNKPHNDPTKWDTTVALIHADVITSVEDLAKYFDIKFI
jgi:hypothetical protein